MKPSIAIERPEGPEAAHLTAGSDAALAAVYDAQTCSSSALGDLAHHGVDFFVARADGVPLGCVALCPASHGGQIERLFTVPEARGKGVARSLIEALETRAEKRAMVKLTLETGKGLAAAVRLYRALGYAQRGAGEIIQFEKTLMKC